MTSRPSRSRILALLAAAALGCGDDLPPCDPAASRPGAVRACPVAGFDDRAFDLMLPRGWDGAAPLPVVFGFHGGSGNRTAAARTGCPMGHTTRPDCFQASALAAGYAVVFPDGTGARLLDEVRTWNAGGGVRGFNCTSGRACRDGVDDMAYLDALLAEVRRLIPVDARRIHATGLSNGAALAHRWACERPAVLASIAPVAGANQHGETGGACGGGVAVLHVHGTDDPCWTYVASGRACLEGDDAGVKVGVAESLAGWRARNGCGSESDTETLPDGAPDDGTRSTMITWRGCRAAVAHLRIEGGGHTWPNGYAYNAAAGRVSRDYDGNARILAFFDAHRRP